MNLPERPFPGDVVADTADQEFWQGCRDERYLLFRCERCRRTVWPAGSCPEHGMDPMRWVPSSGRGRLHTWTVVHQVYASSFAGAPGNVAVVELDDGPLVHATLEGATPFEVGMRVRVVFREIGPGVRLPVFEPDLEGGG